jgi:hypothetical protein
LSNVHVNDVQFHDKNELNEQLADKTMKNFIIDDVPL